MSNKKPIRWDHIMRTFSVPPLAVSFFAHNRFINGTHFFGPYRIDFYFSHEKVLAYRNNSIFCFYDKYWNLVSFMLLTYSQKAR